MAAPTAADFASAMRYSAPTQQALRRSQYLTDALRQMGESSQKIQSGGELAAKLLAVALLRRGEGKSRDDVMAGMRADQSAEAARLLKGFEVPQPPAGAAPMPEMPQLPPTPAAVQAAPLAPAAPAGPRPIDPDTDAMVRTIYGEARGEDARGQQGVASVVLNRSRERGMPVSQVVRQPHQFEPWNNPATRAKLEALPPESPEYQAILANISPVMGGQMPAEFAGADHFYSPGAQAALGRAPPKWDNGRGQDVGRHRFFNLERDAAPQPPPPPPPPNPAGPDVQAVQPFQLAASQMQPGMIPSAGGGFSAPQAGAAPAAFSPQAAAGVSTLQPTPAEIERARAMLSSPDPRVYEAGRAYAMELQQRMVTPIKRDTMTINGVPYSVDPYTGEKRSLGVPQEAQTQLMSGQQLGLEGAPQGAYFQRDPTGNVKDVYTPPTGYHAGASGALTPQQGGPADPYRVQAPAANYAYAAPGKVAPIEGSPADPRNPMNVLEGTKGVRGELAPVVNQAIQLKRNIDSVRTGFAQQNGAGDIAMVNGLQRLIDEGVVREGDVALQLKAQGLAGSISGVRGYMSSEGFFTDPKVRNAVMKTADSLYGNVNENYKARVLGYRQIVDSQFGPGTFETVVFPSDMAVSLGWTAAPNQPPRPGAPAAASGPAPTAGTRGAAIEEARRRGLIK